MAEDPEYVVPVISEELHTRTVPVETGTVRVVKHVEGHEEILEQELKRGRVEIKRVKTERVVSGPEQARHEGKTLIIPVVSERLRVIKEWVVEEEIHLTQIEEFETARQSVTVNHEVAEVQRVDDDGQVVETVERSRRVEAPGLRRKGGAAATTSSTERPLLSGRDGGLLKDR